VISSSLVALINNEDTDNDGGFSGHKANGNINRELYAIIYYHEEKKNKFFSLKRKQMQDDSSLILIR
jgi:hypothetical protein